MATSVRTGSIVTRTAESADATRIAELSGILGYPVDAGAVADRIERLLVRVEDALLVAELEGLVVGWVHSGEQELLESGRRCEILGLVVDPAFRRRGVGRALVSAVEDWAVKRGLEHTTVRSNIAREDSHPFYRELGYIRTKTQHTYRKALPKVAAEPLPLGGTGT